MPLALVTPEDAARRLLHIVGRAADSIETLADLVRAEVHARKHAPRAATLSRVARLLAPAVAVDDQRLEEVCEALEREGDLVLAPGGILYATPLRIVDLKTRARLFGSLATRVITGALGREVSVLGATRTVARVDGLADAVAKLGGALVSPEVWAGLHRTEHADAAFIARLNHRLTWESSSGGSLEKDEALEWRTWEATRETARWRRSNEGRLWWARRRFGGHRRAWTAGASPTTSDFVELNPDDADRARFALSREAGTRATVVVQRAGKMAVIDIPTWLPHAEYRWLSLHAEPSPDSTGTRWNVAADDEELITKILTERLGLVVEVR